MFLSRSDKDVKFEIINKSFAITSSSVRSAQRIFLILTPLASRPDIRTSSLSSAPPTMFSKKKSAMKNYSHVNSSVDFEFKPFDLLVGLDSK